jgi:hypothetical protein
MEEGIDNTFILQKYLFIYEEKKEGYWGLDLYGAHSMIHMDISGHPPFPTSSKQFSDNFGNLLFLAVLISGAILRA